MANYGILPNGKQQFIDSNGNPLASGKVYYYVPNTTTQKNTYQDDAGNALNTNPIQLDANGQCVAYGSGSYRQQVFDVNDNLIWDLQVDSPATNVFGSFGIAPNASGNKLIFSYNGTAVASLDEYGNFVALTSVTAGATP